MNRIIGQIKRCYFGPVSLAGMAFATIVTTTVGPFGTYDSVPVLTRLFYWGSIVVLSNAIATSIWFIIHNQLGAWTIRSRVILNSAVFAIIFPPVVMALLRLFDISKEPHTPIWIIAFISFFITAAIDTLVEYWMASQKQAMPKLAKHLDGILASEIRHVTVNDHYVQLTTRKGKKKLLMRFGDVLAELDGMDGFQVHRSHWVAREAVDCLVKRAGKVTLRLDCGREIPVSRGFQASVQFALDNSEPAPLRLN